MASHFELAEVLDRWELEKSTIVPGGSILSLVRKEARHIFIGNGWGPAVPYARMLHEDGTTNHGYQFLKGLPKAVDSVPEVQGWPEYRDLLLAINAKDSPIESVGCEKGYFQVSEGDATVKLGSYTDVIFSAQELNDDPRNLLCLATVLANALDGCEQWWSCAEFEIQQLRYLAACQRPWGLMIRVIGYGRSEAESRSTWAASLELLRACVAALPSQFPAQLLSEQRGESLL
jgi:hypothetical protein